MKRLALLVLLLSSGAGALSSQELGAGALADALDNDRLKADANSVRLALESEVRVDRWGPILLESLAQPPETPGQLDLHDDAARASIALALAERCVFDADYDRAEVWLDASGSAAVYSLPLRFYLRLVLSHAKLDDTAAREAARSIEESLDSFGPARAFVAKRLIAELMAAGDDEQDETRRLNTAARAMRESHRRLESEQLGDRLIDQQQRALDLLDQEIAALEKEREQQQMQASASGSQGGAGVPTQAASDSRPMEGKGAGLVDPRALVEGDPWGELPPAERRRLTQELQQQLPPGSRELIRAYYRSLAEGPSDRGPSEGGDER